MRCRNDFVRESVHSETFQLKFTGTVQLQLNGWLSWSFLVYHQRDLSKVCMARNSEIVGLVIVVYRFDLMLFFREIFGLM